MNSPAFPYDSLQRAGMSTRLYAAIEMAKVIRADPTYSRREEPKFVAARAVELADAVIAEASK